MKNKKIKIFLCWEDLQSGSYTVIVCKYSGLQLLLQAEKDRRKENRNARLIKEANFRYHASIEDIVFDASRGVEKNKVIQLASCEFIRRGVPILITGAAGTGKSWLATPLGYQGCLSGFHVRYFNMQKLFEHITLARIEASLPKFFDKMAQTDLLILDDFGMKILDGQQLLDFLELIEDRHGRKSTVIISQLPVADWYDVMNSNSTAADAILDRIVHTAHRF
ncbi:MAG: ATP-binding protein [Tannerella sp.]|nr:ATP-binding protein [Tannerella sp.]